jgi:hypothetical protein
MKTMNRILVILSLAFLFSQISANAQVSETPTLKTRPFQFTFFSPVGTNGMETANYNNNFSINLFAGYNGAVSGIELGGFANTLKHDMNGLQMAGFSNVVMGKSVGVQLSGFSNINRQSLKGGQMAGFSNIIYDSATAIQVSGFSNMAKGELAGTQCSGFSNVAMNNAVATQLSGFSNIVKGNTKGSQIAGFSNVSSGSLDGFQLAGFANIAWKETKGAQIAGFANYTNKEISGAQISGFLNIAHKLKGLQFGVFNYCDSVEKGLPIGFLSIVKKGLHSVQFSTDETFYLNASYITGVKHFYNIFTLGAKQKGNRIFWGFGYGVGSSFSLSQVTDINVELVSYQVNHDEWYTESLNTLSRLKFVLSFKVSEKLRIYGGPSYNVLVTDRKSAEGKYTDNGLVPWQTYSKTNKNVLIKMYPGITLGIRILQKD